jgi:hypothetical protein
MDSSTALDDICKLMVARRVALAAAEDIPSPTLVIEASLLNTTGLPAALPAQCRRLLQIRLAGGFMLDG